VAQLGAGGGGPRPPTLLHARHQGVPQNIVEEVKEGRTGGRGQDAPGDLLLRLEASSALLQTASRSGLGSCLLVAALTRSGRGRPRD